MSELKIYAWAYIEERFGRHVVRLSHEPVEGAMPLVLKANAEEKLEAALSQAEANRVDAERLDWAQESLCHVYQNIAEHFQISYLDENGVEATTLPKESLRAAIDAASLTNAVKTKG